MQSTKYVVRFAPAFLALSMSMSPAMPAAKNSTPGMPAAKLYDSGKFSQAAQSYQSAVGSQTQVIKSRAEHLALDLLGLARSQAASGNWQQAEQNFQRALNLAQAMDMPRTFIDQVRAGLVEAQVKQGHPQSDSSGGSTATIAPLPFTTPTTRTIPRNHLHYSSVFPGRFNSNFNQMDQDEQEYLTRCTVAFVEHKYGANSLQAAQNNLDLALFYLGISCPDAAKAPIDKVTAILPNLKAEDQRTLSATELDAAARFADSDQGSLAIQLTQPVIKLVTPSWPNINELSDKMSRLSDAFERKRDFGQAENFRKLCITLLERSADSKDSRLAEQRLKLAALFESQNKAASAIELYDMAIDPVESSGNTGLAVRSYANLSKLYLKSGNQAKARETIQKLLKVLARPGSDNDTSIYSQCFDLAFAAARDLDIDTSRQIYKAVIAKTKYDDDNQGVSIAINQYIKTLIRQMDGLGQPQEAENIYLAVIGSRTEANPENESQAVIDSYADLALYYLRRHTFDKAQTAAEHVGVAVKKAGRNSRNYYRLNELARTFQDADQIDEALKLTQISVDLNPHPSINELSDAVDSNMRQAVLLDKQGNRDKAQAVANRALGFLAADLPSDLSPLSQQITDVVEHQIKAGHVVSSSQMLSEVCQNIRYNRGVAGTPTYTNQITLRLATAMEQENMHESAMNLFKQSLERASKNSGPSSIEVAGILQQYSSALRTAGKTAESQTMQDQSQAIWDGYNRQNRGEAGTYRPYTPLGETLRNYQLRRMTPDSST